MNKILFTSGLVVALAGCSSPANDAPNANADTGPANTVSNAATNSEMVPYGNNPDPAAFNKSAENIRNVSSQPSNENTDYHSRNAPDDSEFRTTMNRKGEVLETRTFRSHPQLLKIERKTVGQEKSLKVYLKNGKAFVVSEDQIPNFLVAAPGNILLAIGLAPAPDTKRSGDAKAKKAKEDQER